MTEPLPARLIAHLRPDAVLLFPESDGPTNFRWYLCLDVQATPGEGCSRHALFDLAREIERRWASAPPLSPTYEQAGAGRLLADLANEECRATGHPNPLRSAKWLLLTLGVLVALAFGLAAVVGR